MKTIIAGSRTFTNWPLFCKIMEAVPFPITEVVSGMASGVDKLGVSWARKLKFKLHKFPADWNKFGKAAGFLRNEEMAKVAEALVAIWDGKSRGTKHMIDTATRRGLKVKVFNVSHLSP